MFVTRKQDKIVLSALIAYDSTIVGDVSKQVEIIHQTLGMIGDLYPIVEVFIETEDTA